MSSSTEQNKPIGQRTSQVNTVFFLLPLFLSSIYWVFTDRNVWPWDQAFFGGETVKLWLDANKGLLDWYLGMVSSVGFKPPLSVWFGQVFVPLGYWFGRIEPFLLLSNLVVVFATLWLLDRCAYRLGAGFFARLSALLLCAGAPLYVGITHQNFVEPIQALTVVALLYFMLSVEKISWLRFLSLFFLLACFAMLAKASSIAFVLAFLVYSVVVRLVHGEANRALYCKGDLKVLVISAIASLPAVLWYTKNYNAVLTHMRNSTSGEVATHYGSVASLAVKLEYWVGALAKSMTLWNSLSYFIFFVIFSGVLVSVLRIPRDGFKNFVQAMAASKTLLVLALSGTVVCTLLGYSMQVNEEPRFLIPVIPLISVMWVAALQSLSHLDNGVGRAIVAAAFAMTVLGAGLSHAYAHGINPFRLIPCHWLIASNPDNGPETLLSKSVTASCVSTEEKLPNVVGVEWADFNANSAYFYSLKQGLDRGFSCPYTSIGYAQNDIQSANDYIDEKKPRFVLVFLDQFYSEAPNFLNLVSKPFAGHMRKRTDYVLKEVVEGRVEVYERRQIE